MLEQRRQLAAKVGYLRIIAPRSGPASGPASHDGKTTYVFRDGAFVEGRGESAGSR